jgi:hypothetical protein
MGAVWRQGDVRVSENLIDVAKVECEGILTVWPQVQDSNSKEGSDCGGE